MDIHRTLKENKAKVMDINNCPWVKNYFQAICQEKSVPVEQMGQSFSV